MEIQKVLVEIKCSFKINNNSETKLDLELQIFKNACGALKSEKPLLLCWFCKFGQKLVLNDFQQKKTLVSPDHSTIYPLLLAEMGRLPIDTETQTKRNLRLLKTIGRSCTRKRCRNASVNRTSAIVNEIRQKARIIFYQNDN